MPKTSSAHPIRGLLATLAAGLMLFFALAAWGISSPSGTSPDEDYHLASIWCGQGERDGLCEAGSTPEKRMIPDELTDAACFAFHADRSAECQGDGVMIDGYDMVDSDRVNSRGQYPSGFYYWTSWLASPNIALSTVSIRLVNAALFTILAVSTWLALPARVRPTLAWSAAAVAIPLTVFLLPSVNPSSWTITSMVVLFPATLGFLLTSSRWRRVALGVLAVVAALLSFGSRGDSAFYSVIAISAAIVLGFRKGKHFALAALLPVLLIVAGIVTFLGAGQVGSAVAGQMGTPANEVSALTVLFNNFMNLPGLFAGAFGMGWGLGWNDTMMPPVVWASSMFVFAGLLFLGLRWQGWRKVLALAGVAGAIFAIPMYILFNGRLFVGQDVQPRYLLPLLILLAAVALAPSRDAADHASIGVQIDRMQLMTIAALLTLANSIALFFNMRRYVAPESIMLDQAAEWWWPAAPSPMTTWALGSLLFGGLMVMLVIATLRVQQQVVQGTSVAVEVPELREPEIREGVAAE